METTTQYQSSSILHLRFVGGIILTLALALGIFFLIMHPPMAELRLMALFLAITALISIGAGYGAYRLGWLDRVLSS